MKRPENLVSPEAVETRPEHTIWKDIPEVGKAVMGEYSVSDPKRIREQYLKQVEQYPLYQEWFTRMTQQLQDLARKPIQVVEYGPGPGVLAEGLSPITNIQYTAIEPGEVFRQMTKSAHPKATIINSTAENYRNPNFADAIVATATTHHFPDKPKAFHQIFNNLKPKGRLIVGEVFLPPYSFDEKYNPTDKAEFVTAVTKYTAAQIHAMPSPSRADIEDQIRTAMLDTLRIEEHKVCLPIFKQQLLGAGFTNLQIDLLTGTNLKIDYKQLGWYFITATKPG